MAAGTTANAPNPIHSSRLVFEMLNHRCQLYSFRVVVIPPSLQLAMPSSALYQPLLPTGTTHPHQDSDDLARSCARRLHCRPQRRHRYGPWLQGGDGYRWMESSAGSNDIPSEVEADQTNGTDNLRQFKTRQTLHVHPKPGYLR
jgi:hypothetical protein